MGNANDVLRHLPHHEAKFLHALKLLVESGKARTSDDLIKYCEQAKEKTAANYLRTLAVEALPVDLLYDALGVHLRIVAHKRNQGLLDACTDRRIGLVLPLPPHVRDVFMPFGKISILVPDGHPVPPHFEDANAAVSHGSRACRNVVGEMEVLVFEAYREKGKFYYSAATADVVDPRLLGEKTHLVVHLRPHRDPDDVPLATPADRLHIL